jgi:hypothetical protein
MRKMSVAYWTGLYREELKAVVSYLDDIDGAGLAKQATSWAYEAALVKVTISIERLMLQVLLAAINRDSAALSAATSVTFPKHLPKAVAQYILIQDGYFDFKGRDGLLGTIKKHLGDAHPLYVTVKQVKYRAPLDRLIKLRNWAAHESEQGKRTAKLALGTSRVASPGSCLKRQNRLRDLIAELDALGFEIQSAMP